MARSIIPATEHITRSILVLRGQRVLLDTELADLYGVTTKRFNEQIRRNRERFPADFMFQLTAEEAGALRSQFATLKSGRGQHRKYLPYAFTEHGAIMAARSALRGRSSSTNSRIWRCAARRKARRPRSQGWRPTASISRS